jgi:hypothetical protein
MPSKSLLVIGLSGVLATAGCAVAPNRPSLSLHTDKTPAVYAKCVYPKWLKAESDTTLSQGRSQATIIAGGKIASNQILEVHRTSSGSQVDIYWRGAGATPFGHRGLEHSARECL